MKMIGPFIFLDIDGVLNGHKAFPNRYCGTDWESVKILNGILDVTGAKIVLVSAWRYFALRGEMTIAGLNGLMHTHGLNCYSIVDHVGHDQERDRVDRGKLIQEWFMDRYGTVHPVGMAIIDDMDLGYTANGFAKCFFQTHGQVGLKGFGLEKINRIELALKGVNR
jgi:hypothetical protein